MTWNSFTNVSIIVSTNMSCSFTCNASLCIFVIVLSNSYCLAWRCLALFTKYVFSYITNLCESRDNVTIDSLNCALLLSTSYDSYLIYYISGVVSNCAYKSKLIWFRTWQFGFTVFNYYSVSEDSYTFYILSLFYGGVSDIIFNWRSYTHAFSWDMVSSTF